MEKENRAGDGGKGAQEVEGGEHAEVTARGLLELPRISDNLVPEGILRETRDAEDQYQVIYKHRDSRSGRAIPSFKSLNLKNASSPLGSK